jgi:beta-lactamase class A
MKRLFVRTGAAAYRAARLNLFSPTSHGSLSFMNRRAFQLFLGSAALASSWAARALARGLTQERLAERCAAIETDLACRAGVTIIDVAQKRSMQWRGSERFAMCSTFKWVAAAHVLSLVDISREQLNRRIAYRRSALIEHSPVTAKHANGPGLTLGELCKATITTSDNTAGNLLLESTGGPAGFTRFVRAHGDAFTRLDRIEPALNETLSGNERDTTTPDAMAGLLQRLLLGTGLSPASRKQLTQWMLANQTSGARFRAGLPKGWQLADKTGTGERGLNNNDVGVFWRPNGEPVVVSVYLSECQAPIARSNAAIAALANHLTESSGGGVRRT